MIWHIFKKDWKLLWPLVAIAAACQLLDTGLMIELGHFGEPHELSLLAQLFHLVVRLASCGLIVMLVHTDTVPGDREDWLVRPIRRSHLLLAKFLFMVVAVHGPALLIFYATGAFEGFPFGDALGHAARSSLTQFLTISMLSFAIASMTRTLIEAVILVLTILILFSVSVAFTSSNPSGPSASGLGWLVETGFRIALGLVATMAIIPLQYLRRATNLSRGVLALMVVVGLLSGFMPWPQAFAMQQWFAADPSAARPIAMAFNPESGRSPQRPIATVGIVNDVSARFFAERTAVLLPVRISTLPRDSLVLSDHAEIRLVDSDGSTIYRGVTTPPRGPAFDPPVRARDGSDVTTYQQIMLPRGVIERLNDRPVRAEIDYYLTLFRGGATDRIAALNGNERLTDFGWCKTRIDDDQDDVELGCLNIRTSPNCVTVVLENRTSHVRNPAHSPCFQNYTPFELASAISQGGGDVKFRDPQGLARYPVDGTQLADAQVVLTAYTPVAHFTRHLTIPEIRLNDWTQAPTPMAGPPSAESAAP